MRLKNSGSVLAEWLFVPKNNDDFICASWIHLFPTGGVLAPGEECDVDVTIAMDISEGYRLVSQQIHVS